ncbi:MAG: hypothetical protein ACLURG_07965 [Gemmiger sp.]
MRMKGNDIAACLVIALGVGGVLAGSLLGVGKQEQALPAAEPQPVALLSPLPHRSLPLSRACCGDRALFRHGG